MVRIGMGLIKNEHGVYHVRRKVPKGLEEATATVLGVPTMSNDDATRPDPL
jgi:hypothetical protein